MTPEPEEKTAMGPWRQIGLGLLIWLTVSAVLFAGAGYLTLMISSVHGRPSFAENGPRLPGPFFGVSRDKAPTQAVSVYLNPESKELAQMTGVLYSGRDGPPRVAFDQSKYDFLQIRVPAQANAKILINNLKDETSCSSPRSAEEFTNEASGEEPVHHLRLLKVDRRENTFGSPLYLLTPERNTDGSDAYFVRCFVNPLIDRETFITRLVVFQFFVFPRDDVSEQLLGDETGKYGLESYQPVRGLTLDLSRVPGSEDLGFYNGFQEQEWAGFESKRVINPGGYVVAHWRDITSEQTRDVLLVVIGTLIAIGATTLIEGLRPVFEIMIKGWPNKKQDV